MRPRTMVGAATILGFAALTAACGLATSGTAPEGGAVASSSGTTSGSGGAAATSTSATSTSGSTTTGSATSAATGSGGASATSGVGGDGGEDCTNEVDDDGDALIDCEDSDCDPLFECVTPPLSGTYATVVDEGDACPGGFAAATTHVGCEACGCSPVAGTCSLDIGLYIDASCTIGYGPYNLNGAGTCYEFNALPVGHVRATPAAKQDGACETDDAQVPETVVPICVATALGGGCVNGRVCAPRVDPTPACALVDGAGACPASYPDATIVHLSSTGQGDGACDCACTANDDETCPQNKVVKLYDDQSQCGGHKLDVVADGACKPTTTLDIGVLSVGIPATVAALGGTCDTTAKPVGAAGMKTLCCQ